LFIEVHFRTSWRPAMNTTDNSSQADAHRNAFNAAFHELGLSWHWDAARYQSVLCRDGERDCLRAYLQQHQAHLLRAYDAEFLIDAIQAAKARCYDVLTAEGCRPDAYINWAEIQQHHAGV
jgi:hypothetical protein